MQLSKMFGPSSQSPRAACLSLAVCIIYELLERRLTLHISKDLLGHNEKRSLFLMENINTLSFLYPHVFSLRAGWVIFIMYYSSGQLLNTNPSLKVNRCFNFVCMKVVFTAYVVHNLTGIVYNKGGKA